MKRIVGIFLALSMGAAMPVSADETVGRWRIQVDAGTCSASTALGDNDLLMVFSRPQGGENEGGFVIANPVGWKGKVVDGPQRSISPARAPSRASMTAGAMPIFRAIGCLSYRPGNLKIIPTPGSSRRVRTARS